MSEQLVETYPCDSCNVEVCYRRCYKMTLWAEKAKEKLAEYEAAQEDGRLVVLPCKVGSKVFMIFKYINCGEWYLSTKEHIVTDILMNWHRSPLLRITNLYGTVKIEDFGKTVFLTREEAEKVLRNLKEQ